MTDLTDEVIAQLRSDITAATSDGRASMYVPVDWLTALLDSRDERALLRVEPRREATRRPRPPVSHATQVSLWDDLRGWWRKS